MTDSMAWFRQITQIPRLSGHEELVTDFLVNLAKEKQYQWAIDHIGNVCIQIPGRGRGVGKPVLVLQAHMDMVCEKKPGVVHDFLKDPIQLYEKDGFLYANGTTLGADNGIGIGLALAVSQMEHIPPLELLFTVEEETSLAGVKKMQPGFFKGEYLINLDSEDDKIITTGCAGSMLVKVIENLEFDTQYPIATTATLKIDELLGGHSGEDINKNRGSATKICLDQLILFEKENIQFRIIHADTGGNSYNAIARFGHVHLAFLNADEFKKAQNLMMKLDHLNDQENPQYSLSLAILDNTKVLSKSVHNRILAIGYELPHGIISLCDGYANMPETSCNLATIKQTEKQFIYTLFYRSFSDQDLLDIAENLKRLATRHSVRVDLDEPDPAWPPRSDNPLLELAKDSFQKLLNETVEVRPVHAGLECGYLEKLHPGMYAISIGPNIYDAHSPDERMEIASVKRIEQLLFHIINEFIKKY
ncbi:MAG: beta-Ala-His dipeptidase [Spirochaetia bacterium]